MLHNGKDVDPVVLQNVLMRFGAWKDRIFQQSSLHQSVFSETVDRNK